MFGYRKPWTTGGSVWKLHSRATDLSGAHRPLEGSKEQGEGFVFYRDQRSIDYYNNVCLHFEILLVHWNESQRASSKIKTNLVAFTPRYVVEHIFSFKKNYDKT